ncbi:MAG: hypothetical protein U0T81_18355 [Saprospiraceae bacterium]
MDIYLIVCTGGRMRGNRTSIRTEATRVLGWNCLDDSTNLSTYGHPSPEPVYYPQHRQWSPQNPLCWGPNRHVMWLGTGKPSGAGICRNLNMVYDDVVFDQARHLGAMREL